MKQEFSDEELMLRYRQGDAAAFELLYHRYKGPLYRYMLRQCTSRSVADELFQDVWASLIQARTRYEVTAGFASYLFRIARNRLIDHYRRQSKSIKRTAAIDDVPAVESRNSERPEQGAHSAQRVQRLLELLSALPYEQREAFLLHEEAGLSVADIAALTGTGQETAKSRLRYAVRRLREGLQEWL